MNDGTEANSKCARLRNPGESIGSTGLLKIIFFLPGCLGLQFMYIRWDKSLKRQTVKAELTNTSFADNSKSRVQAGAYRQPEMQFSHYKYSGLNLMYPIWILGYGVMRTP
jgi:hypothetical protein